MAHQESEPPGLARADVQADDLALALGVRGHGDDRCHADDAAALARLEVGGVQPEIRPVAGERTVLTQLRDAQPRGAGPGVQRPVAIAVAIGRALAGAFVPAGAAQPFQVRLHKQLHDGLGHRAQEVTISSFGQQSSDATVGAAMITPPANTEMMNLHLAEISTQVADGAIAALTGDGAGRHQPRGALVVPDNIVLLRLPPYSPELNPMENVWDYLRQNKLCALVWDSYDEIVEACKAAWNWLIADPERITSIGSREWACVSL